MKVIISPAKKMKNDIDYYPHIGLPKLLPKTKILMEWIQSLSFSDQKILWACNDVIAIENAERFSRMDLTEDLSPALLAYDGIQYTYMAPSVFEIDQFA